MLNNQNLDRLAMRKAIILLSGGIDSTTAVYWAIQQNYDPIVLSINLYKRKKQEKELEKSNEKEKVETTVRKESVEKDKKISELKDKNKVEQMKRCWEFRRDNPKLSNRESSEKLGLSKGSGHKTFKKYVDEFESRRQEQLNNRKETENVTDFEDNALTELD